MSDTTSILYGLLWIFVGFIAIVSGIYLPDINTCDGWCCAKTARILPKNGTFSSSSLLESDTSPIPYNPKDSKLSLNQYTREQTSKAAGSNGAVMVLENFYSGLATLNISHQPIYTMAKLASEIRPENSLDNATTIYTYLHKNKFPLIAISGKKGTAQEIYMAAYMGQTLAKEKDSVLVINGMTEASPALEAWTKLIADGVIHWQESDMFHNQDEDWAKGTYANIDAKKSVAQYLCEIITQYLQLDESKTQYYVISKEREDELRKAYASDKKFTVNNVTTAFHAAVLKVIFPTINVTIDKLVSDIQEEVTLYPKAIEFLEKYILV